MYVNNFLLSPYDINPQNLHQIRTWCSRTDWQTHRQ